MTFKQLAILELSNDTTPDKQRRYVASFANTATTANACSDRDAAISRSNEAIGYRTSCLWQRHSTQHTYVHGKGRPQRAPKEGCRKVRLLRDVIHPVFAQKSQLPRRSMQSCQSVTGFTFSVFCFCHRRCNSFAHVLSCLPIKTAIVLQFLIFFYYEQ